MDVGGGGRPAPLRPAAGGSLLASSRKCVPERASPAACLPQASNQQAKAHFKPPGAFSGARRRQPQSVPGDAAGPPMSSAGQRPRRPQSWLHWASEGRVMPLAPPVQGPDGHACCSGGPPWPIDAHRCTIKALLLTEKQGRNRQGSSTNKQQQGCSAVCNTQTPCSVPQSMRTWLLYYEATYSMEQSHVGFRDLPAAIARMMMPQKISDGSQLCP